MKMMNGFYKLLFNQTFEKKYPRKYLKVFQFAWSRGSEGVNGKFVNVMQYNMLGIFLMYHSCVSFIGNNLKKLIHVSMLSVRRDVRCLGLRYVSKRTKKLNIWFMFIICPTPAISDHTIYKKSGSSTLTEVMRASL